MACGHSRLMILSAGSASRASLAAANSPSKRLGICRSKSRRTGGRKIKNASVDSCFVDLTRVVVDTNILFSALLHRGSKVRDWLLTDSVHAFFSLHFVMVELFKHKE